jgi:hypothetical protein
MFALLYFQFQSCLCLERQHGGTHQSQLCVQILKQWWSPNAYIVTNFLSVTSGVKQIRVHKRFLELLQ